MIIKFNDFINEAVNHDALAQSVEDSLVELGDIGYRVQVKKERDNFKGICLKIIISKPDSHFKISDIKEYTDLVIEFLDEGYTYRAICNIREYGYPGKDLEEYQYKNLHDYLLFRRIELFELDIRGIKGINNIVRSYESSEFDEDELTTNYNKWVNDQNNRDKILQEINELLVELSDSKFDVTSNYIVKDGKNILELWVEKEEPDFDEGEYHIQYEDWYEEGGNIFIIGDVYEPLALLTDWMREKYGAELVDDGMNSDTFELKGGEFQMRDSEVFDPEWKELQKKYYGENYLKKKVAALFVKYVW